MVEGTKLPCGYYYEPACSRLDGTLAVTKPSVKQWWVIGQEIRLTLKSVSSFSQIMYCMPLSIADYTTNFTGRSIVSFTSNKVSRCGYVLKPTLTPNSVVFKVPSKAAEGKKAAKIKARNAARCTRIFTGHTSIRVVTDR